MERHAHARAFRDHQGGIVDNGIALYFRGPHSYSGEDMLELHTHGSAQILRVLLATICHLGARAARPGEFTERAFLNGKLDLAQAEAVADLIESNSERAMRSALRTMQGEFSATVRDLVDRLNALRARLEASIDFPDDTESAATAAAAWREHEVLYREFQSLADNAHRGRLLGVGVSVAIIGQPNVGKSTLLNALTREDTAIVSPTPGTTRDVIAADADIGGIAVRISDTAGMRDARDDIEEEGIRRARRTLESADVVLVVTDQDPAMTHDEPVDVAFEIPAQAARVVVHNKIDLYDVPAQAQVHDAVQHVYLSAATGSGIEALGTAILHSLALDELSENEFVARARHVAAINDAHASLGEIDRDLLNDSPELAATRYQWAAVTLAQITGDYTTDDLLGEIFSRFCIGK